MIYQSSKKRNQDTEEMFNVDTIFNKYVITMIDESLALCITNSPVSFMLHLQNVFTLLKVHLEIWGYISHLSNFLFDKYLYSCWLIGRHAIG